MDDQQIKHLEMIQQIISRMGNNSFLIKGWSLTLVSAIFAVAAQDASWELAWVAIIPTMVFWGLDAYYLKQERLFRNLFDDVRLGTSPTNFSMKTQPASGKNKFFSVFFSRTIWPFHVVLFVCVFVVGSYTLPSPIALLKTCQPSTVSPIPKDSKAASVTIQRSKRVNLSP